MRVRTPDYYKEFRCIDKQCSDTCCAGWEVDLDDASYEYYKTVTGEFGDRLKKAMAFEEGENRFHLCDNGRCPFLNDENLCDLYIALGEDKLCKTCTEHPRYYNDFGDLREKGISVSCPEAARIILSKKTKASLETVVDESLTCDINNLDPMKYMTLVGARKQVFATLESDKSLYEKIKEITFFGMEVSKKLTKDKLDKEIKQTEPKKVIMKKWIEHIKDYELINPLWKTYIAEIDELTSLDDKKYEECHGSFEVYYKNNMYEYDRFYEYFIYRYYMSSVYDYDLISKLKLGAFAVLLCKEAAVAHYYKNEKFTFGDQIEVMHCFSRQFEHSDLNVAAINESFVKEEIFSLNQFFDLLVEGV